LCLLGEWENAAVSVNSKLTLDADDDDEGDGVLTLDADDDDEGGGVGGKGDSNNEGDGVRSGDAEDDCRGVLALRAVGEGCLGSVRAFEEVWLRISLDSIDWFLLGL